MGSATHEHDMDAARLAAAGERDARELTLRGTARAGREDAALLRALRTLRLTRARLTGGAQTGGAAEWLLDNWYLVDRASGGALLRHSRPLRAVFQSADEAKTGGLPGRRVSLLAKCCAPAAERLQLRDLRPTWRASSA